MFADGWTTRPGALADRVAMELREAIASGRVLPGTALPSQRELADLAGTSRTTIAQALDTLSRQGWVEARRKARFVARLPDATRQPLSPRRSPHEPDTTEFERAQVAGPTAELSTALDAARSHLGSHLLGDGRYPVGLPQLRALIAQRYTDDGVPTRPDHIIVTSGAMAALSAVADCIRGSAIVEDPTYQGALQLLHQRRRRTFAWRRTEVWDVDSFLHIAERSRAQLAYLIPDFHNPTGALASAAERRQLARARSVALVVDESLRQLHLDPAADMPPHTAQAAPSTITIDGMSKTIWSGLRIGWLRTTDREMLRSLTATVQVAPAAIIDQLVAVELWPHLDVIIGARIERLRSQRDAAVDALRACGFEVHMPAGGLVCWIDLHRPIATHVCDLLHRDGHAIAPGSRFSATNAYAHHVRLPFTQPPEVTASTIEALRAAVEQLAHVAR